jgi:hypothetical protein
MITQHKITSILALVTLAITGFAFNIAAKEQSEPDCNSDIGKKPLKVANDKLTHPEKTIRLARENLPRCIDTEDKKLTDLAHSLYEKCLFHKLWEPKLPGLPYRWFSISGANDSAYGKCQLLWDTMFILNAWAPLDDDELMRDVFHNYWNVIDNNPEAPRGSYRYGYYDMARELTDKMLQFAEKHDGRAFERYDGTRGIPLGVPDYCWGVTIWNMIVHNVYGVQEDYRTVVVPPHAKGRRLKLGKLELRVTFPGQSGEIKVHCHGESVNVLQKYVPVPEVVFIALPHKTYIISME